MGAGRAVPQLAPRISAVTASTAQGQTRGSGGAEEGDVFRKEEEARLLCGWGTCWLLLACGKHRRQLALTLCVQRLAQASSSAVGLGLEVPRLLPTCAYSFVTPALEILLSCDAVCWKSCP